MQEFINKLNSIEKRTNELIKDLDIKFTAKRLFSFSILSLLDFEESKAFKIIAAENYTDLTSKTTTETAVGQVVKYKKKNTKHQIFLLGNRKLLKLSKDDAIIYLSKGLELVSLYKQYNATRELFQAEFESKFAINIAANNLYVIENIDREDSDYIKYRRTLSNNTEYKKWSSYLANLVHEDKNIEDLKNNELSYR